MSINGSRHSSFEILLRFKTSTVLDIITDYLIADYLLKGPQLFVTQISVKST